MFIEKFHSWNNVKLIEYFVGCFWHSWKKRCDTYKTNPRIEQSPTNWEAIWAPGNLRCSGCCCYYGCCCWLRHKYIATHRCNSEFRAWNMNHDVCREKNTNTILLWCGVVWMPFVCTYTESFSAVRVYERIELNLKIKRCFKTSIAGKLKRNALKSVEEAYFQVSCVCVRSQLVYVTMDFDYTTAFNLRFFFFVFSKTFRIVCEQFSVIANAFNRPKNKKINVWVWRNVLHSSTHS